MLLPIPKSKFRITFTADNYLRNLDSKNRFLRKFNAGEQLLLLLPRRGGEGGGRLRKYRSGCRNACACACPFTERGTPPYIQTILRSSEANRATKNGKEKTIQMIAQSALSKPSSHLDIRVLFPLTETPEWYILAVDTTRSIAAARYLSHHDGMKPLAGASSSHSLDSG
jgi:hypothetical protein